VQRPKAWAAALLTAVALTLVAFQPLDSPWWTGFDFDSAYVASALRLARGERSNFYDHPGAPLQEALAASFTAARVASGEDRDERVDRWLADLDSTRPFLRTWGSLVFVISALLVFLTIAWVMGHAGWGLLGGLLFLGAPDLIAWAAVVKTDVLLAALSVVVVGLTVQAFRRRSPGLYLAAGAVLGYDVSVKVHAVGLLVPLALAVAVRPPQAQWPRGLVAGARAWVSRRRRLVLAVVGAWVALVLLVNLTAAPPEPRPLLELLAGLAALALSGTIAWLLLRRTRAAGHLTIVLGIVAAGLAGLIVPNLVYASFPAPMARSLVITATGGGVNTGARPELSPLDVLEPWNLLVLVAGIGVIVAVRARDRASLLWAAGALSMGLLAYLRYGDLHYYAPAIALLVPLALRALAAVSPRPGIVAALVVGALLFTPYRLGIETAQDRGTIADRTERVNAWVEDRLEAGEVALTELESSDGRSFYLVRIYRPEASPEPEYRFLPVSDEAARYVREHRLRVGWLITGSPVDAERVLAGLGLPGRTRRVDAPGVVYRVT
jgi:hypothetical protein